MKQQMRSNVSKNIRTQAVKVGVGINRLADEASVSRSQMYDVLGGKKGASVDWLDKVAARFGITAWDLAKKPSHN